MPIENSSQPTSATRSLKDLSALLREQLARPAHDSLILVAAAHNELRQSSVSESDPVRIQCLLDVAQFFYISGQTVLGLEPAHNAVAGSRGSDDLRLRRRALSASGVLLADAGNLPAAIEAYAEALELAQKSGDRGAEGATWNNLGAALLYAAQYSDATSCFRRVLQLADVEPGLQSLVPLSLSNMALACLYAEDFPSGLRYIEESISRASEPATANQLLSRVNSETHYSRLLLEINDVERARERCEYAKRFAALACSQRAEQTASVAEGLYEVYAGKVDIGLSRLQGAVERARIMKSTLRDALIAMVKAYDLCGKPQLALVHLRELLHFTRKTQQERALLHHRLHLRTLGFDADDGLESVPDSASRIDRQKIRFQLALLHRQAIAAELVEDPTGEHVFRVSRLSALLGAELGLDVDTCFMLEMSSRLHDIGKVGIPDAILASKNSINPEQRALIRTHTNIGAELLSQSGLPHIQMAVDIARHHHEFWDGSGYPDGIAGGAIPEAARITTLADVYDVLTHARPYKPAWSRERALAEIRRLRGTRFDPAMADTFIGLVERLAAEHSDLDAFLGEEAKESPFIQARQKIAAALEAGRRGPDQVAPA